MISVKPAPGGVIRITASFTDSAEAATTPKTLFWTLTDRNGEPVNSREDVEITTITAEVTVILYGNDLLLSAGDERTITFTGTYDSDTDGDDMPLGEQCESFTIDTSC